MPHAIKEVMPGSVCEKAGIQKGDSLIGINGEQLIDEIDYQAFAARRRLILTVAHPDGTKEDYLIRKREEEPLGLSIGDSLACAPRSCKNHCVFCFIDQMPPKLRPSLYVKDDDWRLSLMMGNFVTLTNVSKAEMDRIIRRRASPLFISVHATDGQVRRQMMRNPASDQIMDRLMLLKEHGIKFHCQVVLCPGVNDGPVLDKTLKDLASLYPAAQSVALVPVGMTRYREKLEKLTPYTAQSAAELLDQVRPLRAQFYQEFKTRFVFPADEFYCMSGSPVPSEEDYEGFPQIENGVGLLRLLESQILQARAELPLPRGEPKRLLIATGTSIAPELRRLCKTYAPKFMSIQVQPIFNDFFGRTITVTGLITGQDLVKQLKDADADEILISSVMLREQGDLFLDDMSLSAVRKALPAPLTVVGTTGRAFYRAICGQPQDGE